MALTKPSNPEIEYYRSLMDTAESSASDILKHIRAGDTITTTSGTTAVTSSGYLDPRGLYGVGTSPAGTWVTSPPTPSRWPTPAAPAPTPAPLQRSDAMLAILKGTINNALLDGCTPEQMAERVAPVVGTLIEELKKEYTF